MGGGVGCRNKNNKSSALGIESHWEHKESYRHPKKEPRNENYNKMRESYIKMGAPGEDGTTISYKNYT